jgi:alpha-beta hydrolase superfamily lysophospholipase
MDNEIYQSRSRLKARHRPSEANTHFAGNGLSFEKYVRWTQALLRRVHADRSDLETLVAGNSPFDLRPTKDFQKGNAKPYRRGVLLTHGLSDSPYHMRHLAAFFQRNGFRVMALLLPGHGTQPGALLDVRWQEWAKAVAYGAECLAGEVDELYLAGFSAGGALSLYHSEYDERVRGLFLFSPALEISSLAAWTNLHKIYSWLLPQAAWLDVMPDHDFYKYESFCKNAAAQMYKLTRVLPRGEVYIPLFAVASADDATVHSNAVLRFMQRARHPCSRLVWYATERIEQQNVDWVNSALPGQRILSSAHTAIVIPPDDTHYGAAGDYANCLHYYPHDMNNYVACRAQPNAAWQGEVNQRNLQHGLLRRLMYNPHYAAMETSMQEFIARLP